MKDKVKKITINVVKIILLILVWMLLFHSCNSKTREQIYEDAYEQGYQDGLNE